MKKLLLLSLSLAVISSMQTYSMLDLPGFNENKLPGAIAPTPGELVAFKAKNWIADGSIGTRCADFAIQEPAATNLFNQLSSDEQDKFCQCRNKWIELGSNYRAMVNKCRNRLVQRIAAKKAECENAPEYNKILFCISIQPQIIALQTELALIDAQLQATPAQPMPLMILPAM